MANMFLIITAVPQSRCFLDSYVLFFLMLDLFNELATICSVLKENQPQVPIWH